MKSVCLYFKIHQPFRLKRYRFFDIGNDHYYYDDFANDEIIDRLARTSYIPMMDTLLDLINNGKGQFKCSLSISGTALEQLQLYSPECIERLKQLADTKCVEFLATPYAHSLASVEDPEEFMREVKLHADTIFRTFGVHTKTFANTELIYDDDIASMIWGMGYKTVLTDGAKHILGWKSPNYVYSAPTAPKLKLLFTNDKLSEDISRNFNNPSWDEYPLTADKYIDWIAALPEEEQIVNLFFSMDTFGSFLPESTGIFQFLRALPYFAQEKGIVFSTPSDAVAKLKPVDEMSVPYPLSGVDEARDISAWKGNDLQNEALDKLYAVAERVSLCDDRRLKQDWEYLQGSDHFYYMCTKKRADGADHAAFSPYDSPFSAFTNYMNVLADFLVRVQEQYPEGIDNEELNPLLLTIRNQAAEIESLNKEVKSLRTNIENAEENAERLEEEAKTEEKKELPAVKPEKPARKKPGPKPKAK